MSMLCTFASSSNSAANFIVIDTLLYCFIMSVEALNIQVWARLGLTPSGHLPLTQLPDPYTAITRAGTELEH